jgi:serine/threonine-protein kinase
MPVQGGTPINLTDAGVARGASWGEDGRIVTALANAAGLSSVSAEGGDPRPLTTRAGGEITHRWPQVLPGAKAVIFTANATTINSYEDATIEVLSLDTGTRKTLWRGGYFGRYIPTGSRRGHLVYVRHGVLFGVPFDPVRLEIEGTPVPLLDDLAAGPGSGAGHFDVSGSGTMVYRSGPGGQPWTIAWQDEKGNVQPLLSKPALYYSPRVSPDGERLAVGIDDGKGADIYTYDWRRDQTVRLTFNAQTNSDPVWAPDGKHVVFRGGFSSLGLWWVRTDGALAPVRLLESRVNDFGANSFSPDGRRLIYSAQNQGSSDLWMVSLDLQDSDHPTAGTPQVFFSSPSNETRPAFSPDGQWVAYLSDETGTIEVYVRAASTTASRPGGKWQVSTGGGGQPIWSRNASKLFFMSENRMMVTDYSTAGGTFTYSKPRIWATMSGVGDTGFSSHDLAPDGKRFVVFTRTAPTGDGTPRINVLFNFFEEIRRLAPGK